MDLFEDGLFDFGGDFGVGVEVVLGGFAALADEVALVGDPGAFLFKDFVFDAEVEEGAGTGCLLYTSRCV